VKLIAQGSPTVTTHETEGPTTPVSEEKRYQYRKFSHAIATTNTLVGYDLEFCIDTGNIMSEYATIPLELTSSRKETVNLLAEVHVAEELSYSLLQISQDRLVIGFVLYI
jgi:hypothetical protein